MIVCEHVGKKNRKEEECRRNMNRILTAGTRKVCCKRNRRHREEDNFVVMHSANRQIRQSNVEHKVREASKKYNADDRKS